MENDLLRKEKKQFTEANNKIATLEKQVEESQMNATVLTQQLEACEKVSDERKSLLDLLAHATAEIRHNEPKTAPVKSNRPKRTSAEQAAKDEETLQGWEQWQKTHRI